MSDTKLLTNKYAIYVETVENHKTTAILKLELWDIDG
jgi:hypothetical protein